MVKQLHPDTGNRPDSIAFSRVVDAYHTLSGRRFGSRIIDFPVRENRKPVYRAAPVRRTENNGYHRKTTSLKELGELLVNGKTAPTRAFAAMRLGNSGKTECYSYLRSGLKDSDSSVVRATIEAIGQIKALIAAPDLMRLFRYSDLQIKLAILDTIDKMPNQFSYKTIIAAGMQDELSSVRRRSLQIFKKIGC